jgi:hypothetical protein
LKRAKAHGADGWIIQIEKTRSSFVAHMHGQRRAQQQPCYVNPVCVRMRGSFLRAVQIFFVQPLLPIIQIHGLAFDV